MPFSIAEDGTHELSFGFGDLVPGILNTNGWPNCLAFVEVEPGEVGRNITIGPGSKLTPVFLSFYNTHSIDIVIQSLSEMKFRIEERHIALQVEQILKEHNNDEQSDVQTTGSLSPASQSEGLDAGNVSEADG